MIISRTPFRISFFGGGTDFASWYKENGGAVLSTTIDKYCYISCRYLPPFFEYKHRIVYSRFEQINDTNEIIHPVVRNTLQFMNIDEGLEIYHNSDLPIQSGLGSSSSFTVGLLHALYALKGKMVTKKRLALEAIHIEQNMIKENVGSQDQVAAAFGSLNKIEFKGGNSIEVRPITIAPERLQEFHSHLMLFFSGFSRNASNIEGEKIKHLDKNKSELHAMHGMVDKAIKILNGDNGLADFGNLLHENWQHKRKLASKVSNSFIDHVYAIAKKNGAIGGKILGAGSGGFILFFVKPKDREKLEKALNFLLHVPFRFDTLGSQIIYYSETGGQWQPSRISPDVREK